MTSAKQEMLAFPCISFHGYCIFSADNGVARVTSVGSRESLLRSSSIKNVWPMRFRTRSDTLPYKFGLTHVLSGFDQSWRFKLPFELLKFESLK